MSSNKAQKPVQGSLKLWNSGMIGKSNREREGCCNGVTEKEIASASKMHYFPSTSVPRVPITFSNSSRFPKPG